MVNSREKYFEQTFGLCAFVFRCLILFSSCYNCRFSPCECNSQWFIVKWKSLNENVDFYGMKILPVDVWWQQRHRKFLWMLQRLGLSILVPWKSWYRVPRIFHWWDHVGTKMEHSQIGGFPSYHCKADSNYPVALHEGLLKRGLANHWTTQN